MRPLRLQGLRHTCATLLLQAGVPVKVVQEHVGHKRIEITVNIYANTLPFMQQDAAAKLAALLHSSPIHYALKTAPENKKGGRLTALGTLV